MLAIAWKSGAAEWWPAASGPVDRWLSRWPGRWWPGDGQQVAPVDGGPVNECDRRPAPASRWLTCSTLRAKFNMFYSAAQIEVFNTCKHVLSWGKYGTRRIRYSDRFSPE